MKVKLCVFGLALAAPLALPQPPKPSEPMIPANLADLVPSDASGLLYIAPFNELEERVQTFMEIVAPELAEPDLLDQLFSDSSPDGFDMDLIDRSLPALLVCGPISPLTYEPDYFGLFFASTDLTTATQYYGDLYGAEAVQTQGSFIGVTPEYSFPNDTGHSPLLELLPEAAVSGIFDLEPLVEQNAPFINSMIDMGTESFLNELESDEEAPEVLLDMALDACDTGAEFLKGAFASLSTVSFTLELEGAVADIEGSLNFRPGSTLTELPFSTGPSFLELTPMISPDAAMVLIDAVDTSGFSSWVRPYAALAFEECATLIAMDLGDDFEGLGPFKSIEGLLEEAQKALTAGLDFLAAQGDASILSIFPRDDRHYLTQACHGASGKEQADILERLSELPLVQMAGLGLQRSQPTPDIDHFEFTFDVDELIHNFNLTAEDAADLRSEVALMREIYGPLWASPMTVDLATQADYALLAFNAPEHELSSILKAASPGMHNELGDLATKLGDAYPFRCLRINIASTLQFIASIEPSTDPMAMPFLDGLQDSQAMASMYTALDEQRLFAGAQVDLTDVYSWYLSFAQAFDAQGRLIFGDYYDHEGAGASSGLALPTSK